VAGPFPVQEWELFSQREGTFNTSPGALAGVDAFKSTTKHPFKKVISRLDRDKDSGNNNSVFSTQLGKKNGTWDISGSLTPSGNAVTPTEPDMKDLFWAHFGSEHKATANTTLAAGSSTTVLNFATGGVVASGTQVGDLIMVDVDATNGMEVRQVTVIATDAVTVDRALSAAPAVGRVVTTGTTYRFLYSSLNTLHLWQFLMGDNFRHKMGGAMANAFGLNIDFSGRTPVAEVTFSGEGVADLAQTATARPTPTTAGEPLIPTEGKVFIGASGKLCLCKASISSDNALELRQNESCTLDPTGVKRTGNGGRYNVTQTLDMLLRSGTVEGYYDAADTLAAYDVLVQQGVTAGKTVAWRTPKWICDVEPGEQDGEVSLMMSGKAYALTVADSELSLAFL